MKGRLLPRTDLSTSTSDEAANVAHGHHQWCREPDFVSPRVDRIGVPISNTFSDSAQRVSVCIDSADVIVVQDRLLGR